MWNPHSVMFEVAWCVTLYTAVLALEFSPLVLERLRWKRALHVMRTIYVPLVIAGVLLSTMHQSSLGTLYVIVPDKLNGLWYTPLLPVFFFITAIAGGLGITIFESFMSYRAFGKRLDDELLEGIARVIVVVLGVYAVWKFQDLAGRGNLGLAFQVTPESTLFWGEMGLGVILPMLLFAIPKVRHNQHGLFFGAMLTVTGFIVNRLNVAVTGMQRWSGVSYMPSWMEFAVTMSIVAAGFIAFYYAVKYLPVFHRVAEEEEASLPRRHGQAAPVFVPERRIAPVFRGEVLAALWVLLFIGAVAVGLTTNKHVNGEAVAALNGAQATAADPAIAARAARTAALPMDLPADFTFDAGADSPGRVTFSHLSHVNQAEPKCATCHAALFSMQAPGKPLTGELNMDSTHGALCGSCHNGTGAFKVDENCDVCHQP
jgi:c(7)-type cytochrome triheme protein